MKSITVGINGFGRIGRTLFRLLLDHPNIKVVAINDLANAETLAHLLKYDSIHGTLDAGIDHRDNLILFNGREIPVLNHIHPKEIDWKSHQVDIVVESTGKFKTREDLGFHIKNGAKKVILSVPPMDDSIKMVVLGVNEGIIDGEDEIISNASCTTNNAAPMIQVINNLCGIEQAYITTVHSYTSDQSLHDSPHRDLRRARAARAIHNPDDHGGRQSVDRYFSGTIRCHRRVRHPRTRSQWLIDRHNVQRHKRNLH